MKLRDHPAYIQSRETPPLDTNVDSVSTSSTLCHLRKSLHSSQPYINLLTLVQELGTLVLIIPTLGFVRTLEFLLYSLLDTSPALCI